MPRPTNLTPEVQKRIVDAIRAGNYAATAAKSAGVAEPTYYQWLERGEGRSKNRPANQVYVDFVEAIRQAEADAEIEVAASTYKDLRGPDATIADKLKYLQVRYPERWGRSRTEITGADGNALAIRVTVERPDDD